MSVALLSLSQTRGNNDAPQDTTVGGAKPLHRFINAQPQLIGIAVLIMGVSFVITTIVMAEQIHYSHVFKTIPPGYVIGALFIICGILFIITEHNPTKRTVTVSLALSIVAILASVWTAIIVIPEMEHFDYYYSPDEFVEVDNMTSQEEERSLRAKTDIVKLTLSMVFMCYVFVGLIIFIVMSSLATAAIRSTRSQAIVVMSRTANTAPTELQDEQSH
ncbi:uncharacterized protein LOC109528687 [Hippocampus comes]|nr:PREDICTED: uncharacterized protein LOC109528687 [Hippocampus comes]